MIHADPSTYERAGKKSKIVKDKLSREKAWVSKENALLVEVFVRHKKYGTPIFDSLSEAGLKGTRMDYMGNIDDSLSSVAVGFTGYPCFSTNKKEASLVIRHPEEALFEAVHKINIAFLYLLVCVLYNSFVWFKNEYIIDQQKITNNDVKKMLGKIKN